MNVGSQGLHPEETFSKAMKPTFCVSGSSGNLIEVVEWKTEKVLLIKCLERAMAS